MSIQNSSEVRKNGITVEVYQTARKENWYGWSVRKVKQYTGCLNYLIPCEWRNRFNNINEIVLGDHQIVEMGNIIRESSEPMKQVPILIPLPGLLGFKYPRFRSLYITDNPLIYKAMTNNSQPRVGEEDSHFFEDTIVAKMLREVTGGQSLFDAPATKHRQLRPDIVQSFKHDKVKDMIPSISCTIQKYLERWGSSEGSVIVNEDIKKMASAIIGTVMGCSDSDLTKIEDTAGTCISALRNKKIRDELGKPGGVRETLLGALPIENGDFFQNLENYSLEDKRAGAILLFLAGQETLASTWTYWMWLLASRPDIQAEIRKEIKEVTAQNQNLPLQGLIKHLTGLRKKIKELHRIFPAAWSIARWTKDDLTIDISSEGGHYQYNIPAGSLIRYSPLYAGRNENYAGENPDQFNPDRTVAIDNLTFGNGITSCPGRRFAFEEIAVGTILLLQRFEISTELESVSFSSTGVSQRINEDLPIKFNPIMGDV
ncbi:MAG: cytochrome P450 [Chlamydiota bacterium]|nr:cytochrome P450 [Chlamydiota bacterium]